VCVGLFALPRFVLSLSALATPNGSGLSVSDTDLITLFNGQSLLASPHGGELQSPRRFFAKVDNARKSFCRKRSAPRARIRRSGVSMGKRFPPPTLKKGRTESECGSLLQIQAKTRFPIVSSFAGTGFSECSARKLRLRLGSSALASKNKPLKWGRSLSWPTRMLSHPFESTIEQHANFCSDVLNLWSVSQLDESSSQHQLPISLIACRQYWTRYKTHGLLALWSVRLPACAIFSLTS